MSGDAPPKKKRQSRLESGRMQFRILADGSLSNKNLERFALGIADGLSPPEAWTAIGRANQGGSWKYRKDIESYGPFKERIAALLKEKDELMADETFGEPKWMAQQMWREARATGNATMMQKAAEMRMKIMERETAAAPPPAGRPGKPVVENPQARAGMDDIRQRLIQAGVPQPGDQGTEKGTNSAPIRPETRAEAPVKIQVGADVVVFEPLPDLDAMLSRAVPG